MDALVRVPNYQNIEKIIAYKLNKDKKFYRKWKKLFYETVVHIYDNDPSVFFLINTNIVYGYK